MRLSTRQIDTRMQKHAQRLHKIPGCQSDHQKSANLSCYTMMEQRTQQSRIVCELRFLLSSSLTNHSSTGKPFTLLTSQIAEFVDQYKKLTQVIGVTGSPEFPTRKNRTNGWKIKAQKLKQR